MTQETSKAGHWLAVFGALLQLALPAGFVWTLYRISTFTAGVDLTTGDPGKIMGYVGAATANLGQSFDGLIAGIGVAVIGGLCFIAAITRLRYRRPWAFWFAVIFGFSSVLIAPLSAPIGLSMAFYALVYRRQFLPDLPAAAGAQG
jgi:hypothetical protein